VPTKRTHPFALWSKISAPTPPWPISNGGKLAYHNARDLALWFTRTVSAVDHLLYANKAYTARFPGARPLPPRLALAVVACMDSRLDLFGSLGLDIGDAHLIRNAGGLPTPDVLRSLAVSQRYLGTREVMIILHTDCGMEGLDDAAFRTELAAESGDEPPWEVPGFTDLRATVRRSVRTVRQCPWLPHRDEVRGFTFDIATAALEEVA
jgi:carbonic anhydrase